MNKKIKFQLAGIEFQLSDKFVNGNVIRMSHVAAANVIKQYVKQTYPNVNVSAKSDSFSMGNSVDVYLSDKYGQPVSNEIAKDIQSFGDQFVYGKFDGMTDMYEYTGKNFLAGGYEIDPGVKYLTVQNRAQHGSIADTVRMLFDMTMTERYNFGMITLDEATVQCRRFGADQKTIDKAIVLYNQYVGNYEDTYAIEGYVETLHG